MSDSNDDSFNVKDLEKSLVGTEDIDDTPFAEVSEKTVGEKTLQEVLVCNKCDKEFDSLAVNANPDLSWCSLCNVNVNDLLNDSEDDLLLKCRDDDNGEQDDDEVDDVLPQTDPMENIIPEIVGYTGFRSDEEISNHLKAAMLGEQTFAVKIGTFGMIEFDQTRDPEDYAIEGRHGFFKFVVDVYNRRVKLVFYGYDLFDGWQFAQSGLLCLSMIMRGDGVPSDFILFKIGKTRCVKPRVDGFFYSIRQNQ